MDKKQRNILSLLLSLALACTLIPVGIAKGWGTMEFVMGITPFFISVLIVCWNNDYAFRRNTDTENRTGYIFIGSFCLVFGAQGLWGCWGENLLLHGLGAALTMTGAVMIRLGCR